MDKSFNLFGEDFNEEEWKKEWLEMPEFIQEDAKPFQTILVHFQSEEDREDYAKLLGQNLTGLTKSIWFPKYDREKPSNFIYKHES